MGSRSERKIARKARRKERFERWFAFGVEHFKADKKENVFDATAGLVVKEIEKEPQLKQELMDDFRDYIAGFRYKLEQQNKQI